MMEYSIVLSDGKVEVVKDLNKVKWVGQNVLVVDGLFYANECAKWLNEKKQLQKELEEVKNTLKEAREELEKVML